MGAMQNSDYFLGVAFYKKNIFGTKINTTAFHVSNVLKMDLEQLKKDSIFLDYLYTERHVFKNVYKISDKNQEQKTEINLSTLYYNKEEGIVKIEFDNSEYWILKEH